MADDRGRLETALRNAHAAGDTASARRLARELRRQESLYASAPSETAVESGREIEQTARRMGAPQWLQNLARRGDAAFETTSQGLTFGFGDELAGLTGGEAERDRARMALESARASYPGQSVATEVAGGAMTMPVLPGAAFSTVPRAAASGAALGGLYGFGSSEGGAIERLPEAGKGAALGGALSAGGLIAFRAIGSALQGLRNASAPARRNALAMVTRRLQNDGVSPDDLRAALRQLRAAGGDVEEGIMDVGRAGARGQLPERAGPNIQGLTRATGNVEGPGKEILRRRLVTRTVGANPEDVTTEALQGTGRRLAERGYRGLGLTNRETTRALSEGAAGYQEATRAIGRRASETAGPLYRDATAAPVPADAFDDALMPLFSDDTIGSFWRGTARNALRGIRAKAGTSEQRALQALSLGQAPQPDDLTVGVLHRLRRTLNDEIGKAARSGERGLAADLISARDEFLDPWMRTSGPRMPVNSLADDMQQYVTRAGLVDDAGMVPMYDVARQTVRGGHEMTEARAFGRGMFDMPEGRFWEELAQLSGPEREAAALGAMRSIVERAGRNPNAHQATRLILSGNVRERLRALWPKDAQGGMRPINDLFRRLRREREMWETMNYVLTGSRTTPLEQDIMAATVKESPMSAILDSIEQVIKEGGARGPLRAAMAAVFNRVRRPGIYNSATNEQVARIVSDPLTEDLINELAAVEAQRAAQASSGQGLGVLGARTGSTLDRQGD